MDDLQNLREEIDSINKELLLLFIRRMELVKNVGKIKQSQGKPIYDRKREEDILQSVSESSPPHLSSYALELFKKMMELSKDYQNDQ